LFKFWWSSRSERINDECIDPFIWNINIRCSIIVSIFTMIERPFILIVLTVQNLSLVVYVQLYVLRILRPVEENIYFIPFVCILHFINKFCLKIYLHMLVISESKKNRCLISTNRRVLFKPIRIYLECWFLLIDFKQP
jgi:hypothetical protein